MGKNTIELASANTDNLNQILSASEEKQNKLTAGVGISLSSTSEISAVVTGEGDSYINVSVSNQTSDNSKHIGVTLSDAFLSIIENLQNTVGSLQETVEDLQEKVDELDKEVNPEVIYLTPEVSLNYGTASASSTSLTPTYSYSQTVTDDSGNIVETITSGGVLTFSLSNASSGTTINNSTGMLSFSTNETYSQVTLGTVTLNVTLNGKTGSASATVYQNSSIEPYTEYAPVVLYDSQTNSLITVPGADVSASTYPTSRYSAVGVVAVPASHNVYGNGKAGVMSLGWMDYNNPDTGSSSAVSMYWGEYNVDTSLSNMSEVPYIGTITQNTTSGTTATSLNSSVQGTSNIGYTPSDNNSGTSWSVQCPHDTNSWYGNISSGGASYAAPSPYLTDGSRNSMYYQTTSPATSANALSDFDGVGNTSVLLELATAQSDWKTADTITNNSGEGYAPAACCCWRYHTDGTSQGDWYLPSCGELGYAYARYKAISNSINTLAGIYSNIPIGIETNHYIWSSTEYSSTYARSIDFNFGSSNISGCVYSCKSNDYYVRAFLRV